MKLTKNKIIMISIAALCAIAVVVIVVMSLGALSVKSENTESISFAEGTFTRFAKSKVTPCEASVKAIESNSVQLVKWYGMAMDAVSRGDMAFDGNVNEAAFKQKMIDEARKLSKLPGRNGGSIVADGFTFGFDAYIGGGELPEKSLLPVLQRQWSDIKLFVELLSCATVEEIKTISIESKPVPEKIAPPPSNKSRKKTQEAKPLCSQERYLIEFVARPGALIKALNAFSTNGRFIIIDSMEFSRESDIIGTALSSGEKKQEGAAKKAKKSRRSRRAQISESAAEGAAAASKKTGFVTEPGMEGPMLVKLSLVTCDFGSRQQNPVEPQKEQEQ